MKGGIVVLVVGHHIGVGVVVIGLEVHVVGALFVVKEGLLRFACIGHIFL